MDWNLRTCARKGHVTYAPTEDTFRERLHTPTPVGPAWRCLRCGDFVIGEPHQRGPADRAPIVLRGRALRDALILRLLSLERFIKGILCLAAAYGVFHFRTHRNGVEQAFNEDVPLLRPFMDKVGWKFEDSAMIHTIRTVIEAESRTLLWVAAGLALYGTLQVIEGVGLWMLKRWGEYFAVVATSLGLPIEIYELTEKVTVIRIGALIINIIAVLYILLSKRLFGLRGGKAAHEAERHETSFLEVEIAANEPTLPRGLRTVPKTPAGVR
ncbi:DUF2127 domain-containing protein [Dactylosporangium sp. NPDC051541]|uniref:DUF2127 domain-containing protein n=1 Tax=Dactylosporangium sp. NPDC051541 TaxID=3363977 RepID=UPI00379D8F69